MKETHPNYRVSTWPSPWSTALWFWAPFFEVVEPRLKGGGIKVRVPAQVNQSNNTAVDTTAFTKPRFSQLPFKATRKRPVPVTDTFFCIPRLSAHESFRCTRALFEFLLHLSFRVRSSRIHFSLTDRGGEMNAWRTNPKGRLRGG